MIQEIISFGLIHFIFFIFSLFSHRLTNVSNQKGCFSLYTTKYDMKQTLSDYIFEARVPLLIL